MPHLSIKNAPEDVVARLRQPARDNHRSLQGELLNLVCRAAQAAAIVSRRVVPVRPSSEASKPADGPLKMR